MPRPDPDPPANRRKTPPRRGRPPQNSASATPVRESLEAVSAEADRLRTEMEENRRLVQEAPRMLEEARRRAETEARQRAEEAQAVNLARARAERSSPAQRPVGTGGAKPRGRRAPAKPEVLLKAEVRARRNNAIALTVFLLLFIWMLYSALS